MLEQRAAPLSTRREPLYQGFTGQIDRSSGFAEIGQKPLGYPPRPEFHIGPREKIPTQTCLI